MNVLVGITGGIACYKTLEYIRLLKKAKYNVKVIMTKFAKEFISPMLVKTISQDEVYEDDNWKDHPLCHIDLARWADAFIIAPCTINTLSKLRYGIADNLLTTCALAYDKYIGLCISANSVMYEKDISQENIKALKNMQFKIIEPVYGLLACNEEGVGKMADVMDIFIYTHYLNEKPIYKDKKALVIGGATKEYIDRVRFISNGSSGKMARYLAIGLKALGAYADFLDISDMSVDKAYEEIFDIYQNYDIIIMNAAVSDYKISNYFDGKIKKTNDKMTLGLIKTKDILKSLGFSKKPHQKIIGFALEEDKYLLKNAKEKLISKNIDTIVANPISVMGSDIFEGYVISKDDIKKIEPIPKIYGAIEILKALI